MNRKRKSTVIEYVDVSKFDNEPVCSTSPTNNGSELAQQQDQQQLSIFNNNIIKSEAGLSHSRNNTNGTTTRIGEDTENNKLEMNLDQKSPFGNIKS